MKLTPELVEAFAGMFLSSRYDNPDPVPDFHRECWELYTSDVTQAMVIAPRNHAKSTALSFAYILAEVMFRSSDYVIFISSTEGNAAEFVSNIYEELHNNDALIAEFGPFEFETDSKIDCIIKFSDGHRFRIIARGAEQKIRGKMWNGKRPNLIVMDDAEEDEAVANKDRREKFSNWFFRAAKQALSRQGKIRVHGTVLHEDSLLARLRKNIAWKHLFYKAHEGFDDFSNILWPEHWSEDALRAVQKEFISNHDAAGYSQEYLNNPMDNSEAFIRKVDFIGMEEEDFTYPMIVCAAADFAVSTRDKADRTCFVIGGKAINNVLYYLDTRVGRWDTITWIEEMFLIQQRWNPEVFWVEDGVIWKSIAPMVYKEMQVRNIFINCQPRMPIKDKATRARSYQRRMRAGACRYDMEGDWYPGFEEEILRFTGYSEASKDDQVDAAALLSLGFDDLQEMSSDDFISEEEEDMIKTDPRKIRGRNTITGY
jgi:hypothetical protein